MDNIQQPVFPCSTFTAPRKCTGSSVLRRGRLAARREHRLNPIVEPTKVRTRPICCGAAHPQELAFVLRVPIHLLSASPMPWEQPRSDYLSPGRRPRPPPAGRWSGAALGPSIRCAAAPRPPTRAHSAPFSASLTTGNMYIESPLRRCSRVPRVRDCSSCMCAAVGTRGARDAVTASPSSAKREGWCLSERVMDRRGGS